jgi:hypothetical protein
MPSRRQPLDIPELCRSAETSARNAPIAAVKPTFANASKRTLAAICASPFGPRAQGSVLHN